MGGQTHTPRSDRRRHTEREREIADLARRQHGVLARRQLTRFGLGRSAIDARIQTGRLFAIHRGVYAVGHSAMTRRGRWMAAVLASGDGAALSHGSAAALWGMMRPRGGTDITSQHGRQGRSGIRLHRGRLRPEELAERDRIPVTSVPRTLLDLADVIEGDRWERVAEEADRLGLLELAALERVCDRAPGRRGLKQCRRLIEAARAPIITGSALEDLFAEFCDRYRLPHPTHNVLVEGMEVDALWALERMIVELDGFAFHHHRTAFERDRARDAALQAAGYRVIRLTHRRLEQEPSAVAAEIRRLLRSRA
jgi:Protein of unknown function (DUF559)/Transcriptional regulator, AbiEi antitoxin